MSQNEPMDIALPPAILDFVREQVTAGGYGTVSDYVSDLIRAEQRRKAAERLDQELLDGLDSGPATPMTREDWNAIRREVADRHSNER